MSLEDQGPSRQTPSAIPAVPAGPPPEALAEAAVAKAAEASSPGRERGPNGRFVPKSQAAPADPLPAAEENFSSGRESFVAKADAILNNARQVAEQAPANSQDASDADDLADLAEMQSPGETSPTIDPAGNSEGLSSELRMIAERLGVSQDVLSMATSDDALRIAIAMAAPNLMEEGDDEPAPVIQQQRQPQGQPPLLDDDLRIQFLLDSDSADPEDPYYKQSKHTTDKVAELQDVVAAMASELISLKKERVVAQRDEVQQKFDATLDATGWSAVGKKSELRSMNQPETQARVLLFPVFKKLSQALPELPAEQVAELAYQQVFKKKPVPKQSPNEAARIEALKRSNAKILGTGSGGPPAPERPLTARERFERKVKALTNGQL